MLLNREEIVQMNLIAEGFDEDRLRDGGYDLTIAKIIGKNDEQSMKERSDWDLRPQGIAVAVSREVVRLPEDIIAHASVKTSLCRNAVIALNTGIVDGGWSAPISSVIVNFGREHYSLREGEVFLRLTFTRISKLDSPSPLVEKSRSTYECEVRSKIEAHLSDSFMDLELANQKHQEKFASELRSILMKWIPFAAFALALVTFFMNFGLLTIVGRSMPWDTLQVRGQALSDAVAKQNEYLKEENRQLQRRVDAMNSEIERLKSSTEKKSRK